VHCLWWACGLIREHRGDSHVAAAAICELSHCRFPGPSRADLEERYPNSEKLWHEDVMGNNPGQAESLQARELHLQAAHIALPEARPSRIWR
jgi:hypothetical protein